MRLFSPAFSSTAVARSASSPSSAAAAVAQELLSDAKYDIEFNGYLSNHAKHAVVALWGLGAPPERIQGYWDMYTTETPYGLSLHPVDVPWDDVEPASPQDLPKWRGRKEHWQEQVAFFQKELDETFDGDTDGLVRKYAPDLLDGIAGALTHGIIHLGWAIAAQSPQMIVEGLAYLNFCHLGVDRTHFRHGDASGDEYQAEPIDSFMRVARTTEEEDLAKKWVDSIKSKYDESFHPELVVAGFQWHVAKLAHEPHPVATTIPSWITGADDESEAKVWEGLYRAVAYLYLATRDPEDGHGNFVVLHLITSLWGLEQVCRVLKEGASNDYPQSRQRALSQFYASAVVVLSTAGFVPSSALEKVRLEIGPEDTSADFDWEPTIKAGIAEKEEHNIKLVYVTRELWNRYEHWKGFSEAGKAFTLTPNVGGGTFSSE